MLANIFSSTLVLIGTVYLSYYIKMLMYAQPNYLNQRIISEDTDVSPKQNNRRRMPAKFKVISLTYFAILLGMLTTLIYRDIKEHGMLNYSKFRLDFLLSAIVSPMVLQAALSNHSDISKQRSYSLFLYGYQNGFFWQTIFGELAGKLPA